MISIVDCELPSRAWRVICFDGYASSLNKPIFHSMQSPTIHGKSLIDAGVEGLSHYVLIRLNKLTAWHLIDLMLHGCVLKRHREPKQKLKGPHLIQIRIVIAVLSIPLPWANGYSVAIQCAWNWDRSVHWNATGEIIVGSQCVSNVLAVLFQWPFSGVPVFQSCKLKLDRHWDTTGC